MTTDPEEDTTKTVRITPEDLDKTRFIVSDKNEFLSANQSESEEIGSEIMESLQKHEARIAQLQRETHPEASRTSRSSFGRRKI